MPNTGTSRATGVMVGAGWRASSQPQAAKANKVLPADCHTTAAQAAPSAWVRARAIAGQPSKTSDSETSGGTENRLAPDHVGQHVGVRDCV